VSGEVGEVPADPARAMLPGEDLPVVRGSRSFVVRYAGASVTQPQTATTGQFSAGELVT